MQRELERVFREESRRAIATLTRFFGNLDVAEEAVQEAFVVATQRWPESGLPPNPGAWITTTARNRGLDKLRRESTRDERQRKAMSLIADQPPEMHPVEDDQLRLIFTCCHPALAPEARVALTLRMLGGLTTPEIAKAFLVSEPTMAARITRAKHKIRDANIPYRIPEDHELPDRMPSVLNVLYLIFNEGYITTAGSELTRSDLTQEAIRLTRVAAALMPDEAEVIGLLALMLLIEARRGARVDKSGSLVLLADQNRSLWDHALAEEGRDLATSALRRQMVGPYQLQAAIAAVHSEASAFDETDWAQIVALYDQLLSLSPTPVVAMNRAIAIGELKGAEAGLAELATLQLDSYYLWHSSCAELLRRLGNVEDSRAAYERAVSLAENASEREFLQKRMQSL